MPVEKEVSSRSLVVHFYLDLAKAEENQQYRRNRNESAASYIERLYCEKLLNPDSRESLILVCLLRFLQLRKAADNAYFAMLYGQVMPESELFTNFIEEGNRFQFNEAQRGFLPGILHMFAFYLNGLPRMTMRSTIGILFGNQVSLSNLCIDQVGVPHHALVMLQNISAVQYGVRLLRNMHFPQKRVVKLIGNLVEKKTRIFEYTRRLNVMKNSINVEIDNNNTVSYRNITELHRIIEALLWFAISDEGAAIYGNIIA